MPMDENKVGGRGADGRGAGACGVGGRAVATGAGAPYSEEYARLLAERRARLLELVGEAAAESGRRLEDVLVCAVSKTVDVPEVAAARAAGYGSFAENRPQELERKLSALGEDPAFEGVRWHLIGNLQENKINRVLACAPALVHSISSLDLARAVSKRAEARAMRQDVLLEVNVSGEESKSGMAPDGLRACFDEVAALPGVRVRGLMTMAPQGDPLRARETFSGLRGLRDEIRAARPDLAAFTELSMGMSEDFGDAVREGATIIRLGRIAFDPAFPLG